eukprot:SAG11_NODE_10637_length_815_cov_1.192737_2_plen_170_part_01
MRANAGLSRDSYYKNHLEMVTKENVQLKQVPLCSCAPAFVWKLPHITLVFQRVENLERQNRDLKKSLFDLSLQHEGTFSHIQSSSHVSSFRFRRRRCCCRLLLLLLLLLRRRRLLLLFLLPLPLPLLLCCRCCCCSAVVAVLCGRWGVTEARENLNPPPQHKWCRIRGA